MCNKVIQIFARLCQCETGLKRTVHPLSRTHIHTHTRTSLTPTHFYFIYTVVTFTDLFKCMIDWQLNFTYQKHRYTNHPVQTACKSTRFQNSHHRHGRTFLFWCQRSRFWQVTTDIFCMNRKLKNSNKKATSEAVLFLTVPQLDLGGSLTVGWEGSTWTPLTLNLYTLFYIRMEWYPPLWRLRSDFGDFPNRVCHVPKIATAESNLDIMGLAHK